MARALVVMLMECNFACDATGVQHAGDKANVDVSTMTNADESKPVGNRTADRSLSSLRLRFTEPPLMFEVPVPWAAPFLCPFFSHMFRSRHSLSDS